MRNAILEKVTFHRIPNRSTNFWPLCLPVKMASKTVIKPIALCQGSAWALGWNCGKLRSVETCRAHDFTVNENESILSVILLELETCPEAKFNCKSRAQNKKNISEALTKVRSNWGTSIVGPKKGPKSRNRHFVYSPQEVEKRFCDSLIRTDAFLFNS